MKICDRCGKELTERDRTTICLECEVALADEVIKNLKSDNASLKAERDAAVEALGAISYPNCSECIDEGDMTERCINCDRNPDTKHIGEDHWKWRCPVLCID